MASRFTAFNGASPSFFDVVASSLIPPGGPSNVISSATPSDAYVLVRLTSIVFTGVGATTISLFNADHPTLKHTVTISASGTITNPQTNWIFLGPIETMRISYQSADTTSVCRVSWEVLSFVG